MANQIMTPKVTVIDPVIQEKAKLRVAAYARVSSDSADPYLAQVDYYTRHIEENPDWELADIYADGPIIIGLNQVKPCGTRGCAGLVLCYFQTMWGDTTNFDNRVTLSALSY